MLEPTANVLTINVADTFPDGIMMLAGTVAAPMLDDSFTTMPVLGAGPLMLTVPVEFVPPTTLVGLSVRLVNSGGFTVSVVVTLTPLKEAVRVTVFTVATAVVLATKLPVWFPADINTVAGTMTDLSELVSLTVTPPLGAGPLSPTVPAEELPPETELGFTVIPTRLGGVTVSIAVRVELPHFAVIVA